MSSSQFAVAFLNLREGIPKKIVVFGGVHVGLSLCFVAFDFSIQARGRPKNLRMARDQSSQWATDNRLTNRRFEYFVNS